MVQVAPSASSHSNVLSNDLCPILSPPGIGISALPNLASSGHRNNIEALDFSPNSSGIDRLVMLGFKLNVLFPTSFTEPPKRVITSVTKRTSSIPGIFNNLDSLSARSAAIISLYEAFLAPPSLMHPYNGLPHVITNEPAILHL